MSLAEIQAALASMADATQCLLHTAADTYVFRCYVKASFIATDRDSVQLVVDLIDHKKGYLFQDGGRGILGFNNEYAGEFDLPQVSQTAVSE